MQPPGCSAHLFTCGVGTCDTVYRILLLCLSLMGLAACGGNSGAAPKTNTTPPPASSSGVGTSPVTSPTVVNAAAGQTASGVDITVSAPAATSAPNAQDLGASGNSAFNTGDVIHRGQTARVLLFGTGLSAAMQVTIRGPADIQVSNIVGIQSTDKPPTPGISFTATVSSSAALGARTVVLQTSAGDVTTFTGGLEVVP